jgi:hypothetical protein
MIMNTSFFLLLLLAAAVMLGCTRETPPIIIPPEHIPTNVTHQDLQNISQNTTGDMHLDDVFGDGSDIQPPPLS